jgi:hypothetical protein
MRQLLIAGPSRPAPPGFAAVAMGPGCIFYASVATMRQGVEMVEREIAEGKLVLPVGVSPAQMTINQQAWALAHTCVAGRA